MMLIVCTFLTWLWFIVCITLIHEVSYQKCIKLLSNCRNAVKWLIDKLIIKRCNDMTNLLGGPSFQHS